MSDTNDVESVEPTEEEKPKGFFRRHLILTSFLSIVTVLVLAVGTFAFLLNSSLGNIERVTGPLREDNAGVHDLDNREIASLAPAIILIIGLGFFPQPMLNVINPAIDEVASHIGKGDPEPKSPTQIAPAETEGGH